MVGGKDMKIKVAFICVHNSCRSQIAEALGKLYGSEVFESYSAGTEKKQQINEDAVRIMKNRYGIDMEKSQHPKLIEEIPEVQIAVKMGCNVVCPHLPAKYTEDWNLDDPTGKDDKVFNEVIDKIEDNIKFLVEKIKNKSININ